MSSSKAVVRCPLTIRPSLLPASFQERSTSSTVLSPSTGQRIECHLRSWRNHPGGTIQHFGEAWSPAFDSQSDCHTVPSLLGALPVADQMPVFAVLNFRSAVPSMVRWFSIFLLNRCCFGSGARQYRFLSKPIIMRSCSDQHSASRPNPSLNSDPTGTIHFHVSRL